MPSLVLGVVVGYQSASESPKEPHLGGQQAHPHPRLEGESPPPVRWVLGSSHASQGQRANRNKGPKGRAGELVCKRGWGAVLCWSVLDGRRYGGASPGSGGRHILLGAVGGTRASAGVRC